MSRWEIRTVPLDFTGRSPQRLSALEERPRHGRRQPAQGREASVVEQLGAAFGQGFDFLSTQQPREPPPQLTVEPIENPPHAVVFLLAQRLAQPPPEHGPQLVLHMEGEPVVYPVAVPAGHGEDVGACAVGVVDEHVEHRHAAQRRRVPVGQDEPPPVPVLTLLNV